ncbi:MAG: hypothetical protein ACRC2T_02180 [Thermoguttaceae bacterium]
MTTKTERKPSMVIPGFSVLKMKQEIQEKIGRETEGMTPEEVREYTRRGSELYRKELEEMRPSKKH